MSSDPGPTVEGYVERNFEDRVPNAREGDVYIAEFERDFNKDEEQTKVCQKTIEKIKLYKTNMCL